MAKENNKSATITTKKQDNLIAALRKNLLRRKAWQKSQKTKVENEKQSS